MLAVQSNDLRGLTEWGYMSEPRYPQSNKYFFAGAAAAQNWQGITPSVWDGDVQYFGSGANQIRTLVWVIDAQGDFMDWPGNDYPNYLISTLPVNGAIQALGNGITWIANNINAVTEIDASGDLHFEFQIFHPPWWKIADPNDPRYGQHPDPYELIPWIDPEYESNPKEFVSLGKIRHDVETGYYEPTAKPVQSKQYVRKLYLAKRKILRIWPLHCLDRTPGQALHHSLSEIMSFHAGLRKCQNRFLFKGMIDESEYYSMLEPEVHVSNHPMGGLNIQFLDNAGRYNRIILFGYAWDYCFFETLRSAANYYDNSILSRLEIFVDACAAIDGNTQWVLSQADIDAINPKEMITVLGQRVSKRDAVLLHSFIIPGYPNYSNVDQIVQVLTDTSNANGGEDVNKRLYVQGLTEFYAQMHDYQSRGVKFVSSLTA